MKSNILKRFSSRMDPTSLIPRLLCVGGEKKEPGTHRLGMLSSPRISDISVKSVLYTNLRKTCRPFLGERCLALTTLSVDDDEGVIKAISFSLIHASVCSS